MLIESELRRAAPAPRTSSQLLAVLVCGAPTVIGAALTGRAIDLTVQQWLGTVMATALALWVGGAVSGQIVLARLLDGQRPDEVTRYLRQLLWLIPRFYVPLGLLAVGIGCYLVATGPAAFSDPAVYVPLALYAVTSVAGSGISAPGYVRLLRRLARDEDIAAPANRRTLLGLAWLNRVELTLVVGIGFPLLVSLA